MVVQTFTATPELAARIEAYRNDLKRRTGLQVSLASTLRALVEHALKGQP